MDLNRIDCQYVDIDVTATLRNGDPAALSGVDVTILAFHRTPDATTVWIPSSYDGITATVLLAGSEVTDTPNSIAVPEGGGDLWIRIVDSPEIDAAYIDRINVS